VKEAGKKISKLLQDEGVLLTRDRHGDVPDFYLG